jgi:D-aminopeptidase
MTTWMRNLNRHFRFLNTRLNGGFPLRSVDLRLRRRLYWQLPNVLVSGGDDPTLGTLANHVPKTNPRAKAALAMTGSQIAQTCFSSPPSKSSICCALAVMLRRIESLALLTLAITPSVRVSYFS